MNHRCYYRQTLLLTIQIRNRIDTVFNDQQKVKLDIFGEFGNNDGDFVDIYTL